MTQIAQIVSLSLNQAMGEFNMRLNGLQQQVVHQQNVFAQAQVQQAALTTSSGTRLRRHHLLSQVVSHHLEIVHPPVHTQFSKEHCGTATRFAAVASETD